jgi:uncharacterized protein HemX
MTFKRFLLCLVFLVGLALGWFARGKNDGNRIESEVKVEVEKAEAVEKARWEKQVRDLNLANGDLQDKLAVASARETTIDRMKKQIDELQAKVLAAGKPTTTPAEPAKPPEAKPDEPKSDEPKP